MTDTEININCPACGMEMKKIYDDKNGVYLDICLDGCGGIFFDNRELEKFDEQHENCDAILESIRDKEFKNVDEFQTRNCPACGTPMVKQGAGKGNVVIDVCNVCGAKFLDNGELQKIRNAEVSKSSLIDNMVNEIFEENMSDVIGVAGKIPAIPKSAQRRQFFVNMVQKWMN